MATAKAKQKKPKAKQPEEGTQAGAQNARRQTFGERDRSEIEGARAVRAAARQRSAEPRSDVPPTSDGCVDDLDTRGTPFKLVEGFRTVERQQWLFGSGRPNAEPFGRDGPIVTYRDGVKALSNHQGTGQPGTGCGADCYPMRNGKVFVPPSTDRLWDEYATALERQGLIAGHRWTKLKDSPHAEMQVATKNARSNSYDRLRFQKKRHAQRNRRRVVREVWPTALRFPLVRPRSKTKPRKHSSPAPAWSSPTTAFRRKRRKTSSTRTCWRSSRRLPLRITPMLSPGIPLTSAHCNDSVGR